ncbi:conjugal transfer protein [alpha proteobacterium AAP38]|nr:conjugal transfer protein [alpha proteobacterium AAP38]
MKLWLAACLVGLLLFRSGPAQADSSGCTGSFVNPIADICWSCLFPLTLGSITLVGGDRLDTSNPGFPLCTCPAPPPLLIRPGIAIGFWEPVRLVDVAHVPWCFVNLGGLELPAPIKVGGTKTQSRGGGTGHANWHVHWYVYPLIYWLELLVDFLCLEMSTFDIAYITEIDPMWLDDELTFLINPEAALFNTPLAQAACAADCVAASAGLPLDPLFWCAGCQGSLYPLDGNIQAQTGAVQGSLLATERMAYKLHRELILWGSFGSDGMCGRYPMPVMRKSQYRSQMVNPVPTSRGPNACPPFGRTTTIYESNRMVPVVGENFGYLIWRKRNCCAL